MPGSPPDFCFPVVKLTDRIYLQKQVTYGLAEHECLWHVPRPPHPAAIAQG